MTTALPSSHHVSAVERQRIFWLRAAAIAGCVALLALGLQKLENRLLAFRRALVTIGANIESMTQMVQDRAQQDPGHVLDRQPQAIQRMRHFYECNLRWLNEAHSALFICVLLLTWLGADNKPGAAVEIRVLPAPLPTFATGD